LRVGRVVPRQVSFSIFGLYESLRPFRFKIQWDISNSAFLPYDSSAYLACEKGDWLLLRQLLAARKVGISDTTVYGDTLLHIAARANHYDMVKELVRAGVPVNAENDFGRTPLHMAVRHDRGYEVSQCLLGSGADLGHQDIAGRTPLHYFFGETSQQLIQYHQEDLDNTIQDDEGMSIAHYVAWTKSSKLIDIHRCLHADPASLSNTDEEGRTVLHLALQRGNLQVIGYLLNHPDTNAFRPDWRGRTLLHYATESRRTQTIDILLERGFILRAADLEGR
ncbi:ankryin repeat S-palmitoyl transferase, partial [Lophium mytilinum]